MKKTHGIGTVLSIIAVTITILYFVIDRDLTSAFKIFAGISIFSLALFIILWDKSGGSREYFSDKAVHFLVLGTSLILPILIIIYAQIPVYVSYVITPDYSLNEQVDSVIYYDDTTTVEPAYVSPDSNDDFQIETVSTFQKGYEYYQTGEYDQSFPLLLQAANDGYPDAEMYVGCCYRDGKGVEKDLYKAFDWFGLAANKGNAQAQYNYGYCYYKGDGVKKNHSLAFEWFQKSAEQNNKFGLLWTGYCYHKGIGVEKNYENAYKHYVEARVHGNRDADTRIKELNQDWGK